MGHQAVSNELATTETTTNAVLAAIEVATADERLADWLARLGENTARAYTRDLLQLATTWKSRPSAKL